MASNQAEMFKVLGVENRIRIIELLKEKGSLGVNELAGTLGITPSAVSQHLKILRHAGLVHSERKGYWVPYKVNEEALLKCQEQISQVCSCGCEPSGHSRDAELEKADDKLALLRSWEQELQKELNEVRCRIAELSK